MDLTFDGAEMGTNVTMPRWPAYLMGLFAVACAYPAVTTPAPGLEAYRAVGIIARSRLTALSRAPDAKA